LPPFQGGALALFSYDFVRYIEDIPSESRDDLGIPDAHVLFIDRLMAFDHRQRRAWIVICPGARETSPVAWAAAYDSALGDLADLGRRISAIEAKCPEGLPRRGRSEIVAETSEETYTAMVRRAKEYIAAGDIFQANISLRVSARISGIAPWDMYLVLRGINPSPFGGFLDMGEYQIVSSSPERLVMVRDGIVETRPIAGTRPRGRTKDEDASLRDELLLNEKERAEHIMLIDLERNDLGRVSEYGTVEVDELMTTEEYSHVIHIVSNVSGRLARDRTCIDALRATFPGGTITGVPKVRCMQIIDELEPTRRGPYTGSMGYIGYDGCMDLNIIIRTFTVKDGLAHVQAGAGIVADSDPAREYRESLKKAEALLATLGRLSGDAT
jgi:aminodeoxychorismate synthase component I